MKLQRTYKRGELAKILLVGLAAGGFIVVCAALPGVGLIYKLFGAGSAKEHFRVRQALRGLERRKLVRIYSDKGKEVVEITKQGKKEVLKFKLGDLKLDRERTKDGFIRVVMFDIPETKRRVRDEVRFRLVDMGFEPLQDSSFATPYECKKEVDFIREYYNLGSKLVYLKVKELDRGE